MCHKCNSPTSKQAQCLPQADILARAGIGDPVSHGRWRRQVEQEMGTKCMADAISCMLVGQSLAVKVPFEQREGVSLGSFRREITGQWIGLSSLQEGYFGL